jgi:hypothetical protein
VRLAEAEVAGPAPPVWNQLADHPFQADAPISPRQLTNPVFEPSHRLVGDAPPERRFLAVKPRNDRCHGRATAEASAVMAAAVTAPTPVIVISRCAMWFSLAHRLISPSRRAAWLSSPRSCSTSNHHATNIGSRSDVVALGMALPA